MLRFADPGGRIYGAVGTSNVNLLAYWTTLSGTAPTISAGNGRSGSSSLRFTVTLSYIQKVLDSQQTWGAAFAIRTPSVPTTSGGLSMVGFYDSGTNQVDLRLNPDATISVYRNGTLLGTSTAAPIGTNTWNHFEFKAKIDPSVGTYQVWANGVSILSATGVNTRSSSNSSANSVRLGPSNASGGSYTVDFDDIVIYDGQTTDAQGNADITGPIGDCGVYWLLPSSAGTTTQFTPDSGSNYARVADTTIDTTSYVETSTVNNIDTYAITDALSTITSIKSLQVINNARKTDTGSRGVKAMVRTASTNYIHTNEISLPDSFIYFISGWGSNPNTTSAWTLSDINAIEAGQKVSS